MYYYKARIYSPTLGRFLQTDPIGYEDNINLYAYVGNDPVNMIDPSGECGILTGTKGCLTAIKEVGKEAYNFVIGDSIDEIGDAIENPSVSSIASAACGVAKPCKAVKKTAKAAKKGKKARDSSKSSKHGDAGRATKSAKEKTAKLDAEARSTSSKKERKKLKKKAQRIREDAARKKKGEEHGTRRRR